MSAPWLVGVTGPVGAGKSSVLRWLDSRSAEVLDADRVVHDLLARDEAVIAAVEAAFGRQVRGQRGIDRTALGRVAFAHPEDLERLEAIIHPAVHAAIGEWRTGVGAAVAVVEGVKLVESGFQDQCDEVWLVTCDIGARRRRLAERGWSAPATQARLAAAPPMSVQLAAADIVIDNSGPWHATERQLHVAWRATQVRAAAA